LLQWDIISTICLGTDSRLTDNFREKALVLDEIEMFMKTIKYGALGLNRDVEHF
jgi:hypothetical protein